MYIWYRMRWTVGLATLACLLVVAPSALVSLGRISPVAAAVVMAAPVLLAGVMSGWFTRHKRRRVGPFLLPPPPPVFIGREEELEQAGRSLEPRIGRRAGFLLITGPAGIGKTALALAVAHRLAARYPDGQLYARMSPGRPMLDDADGVLTAFVAALQDPDQPMPRNVDALTRRYRSLTARRRLLIVLDDLDPDVDIEPLLAAGPACAVLITASRAFRSEPRAKLELPPLDRQSAMDLLAALIGRHRVDAEYPEALEIAQRCDGHPLTLQIAAGALARRQNWRLDRVLQVSVTGAAPAAGEVDTVRALIGESAMDLSFALLGIQERRAAIVLGVLNYLTFEPWMLAVALSSAGAYGVGEKPEQVKEETAVHLAQHLVDARLVERLPDREGEFPVFRIEDYVHQYARLCRSRSFSPERDDMARAAIQREAERRKQAAARPVDAVVNELLQQGRLGDALNSARERLEIAEFTVAATGTAKAVAPGEREQAHAALAVVYTELGDNDNAWYFSLRAGEIADRRVLGRLLRCKGVLRYRSRDLSEAEKFLSRAEDVTGRCEDQAEHIMVLRELATIKASQSDGDGERLAERALRIATRSDRVERTPVWLLGQWAMGAYLLAAGRGEEADLYLANAQAQAATSDHRLWEAWIGEHRARAALLGGVDRVTVACEQAYRAADLFGAMRHRYGVAHCRLVIGRAYLSEGNNDDGIPVLEEALETFVNCGDRWIEAKATTELARALADARPERRDEAIRLFEGAARIFIDHEDTASAAAAKEAANEIRARGGRAANVARRLFTSSFVPSVGTSGTLAG